MTKIIYLSLLIILLIAPLTIAEVGFGEDSFGVHYASPDSPWFNNNTGSVNHSSSTNTWITSEGNLDDVSDIEHNWLTNLAWSVAGHTIDTTLGMNDNELLELINYK